MFTSTEQVMALTGYEVSLDLVNQAQGIIETFLGKVEQEIDNPYDLAVLGRATAYQAAYMKNNSEAVYEQIAIRSIAQADGGVVMDRDRHAPWIAPLAHMAISTLSWKRSRSVKTGPIFEGSSRMGWFYD